MGDVARAVAAPGPGGPTSIVLHGHFYQPPREDPWTDEVPEQPSAAPFHDWNERIERECYGPIVRCRVLADARGPERVVNALEWMSFDVGPTLLVWLERHAPETYGAILEADHLSARRLHGHGNALAMPYHHPILPLSTPRDRVTEIRWGIADFRRRFGREPEGMWLPETAVDDATLDAVAAEGIRFTILAPHQVDPVPADGRPARYVTRGGREIALFVYDGALSHGVAFGGLLRDGVAWAETMAPAGTTASAGSTASAGAVASAGSTAPEGSTPGGPRGPWLRSIATDGETFGHHHVFAEMALAKAIVELRDRPGVRLENFASFLAREGAHERVALVEPSSWSCVHGVERWRSACGCRMDASSVTHQRWRGPLREALEGLADGLHGVYEREGGALFADPWAVRDAYGEVPGPDDAERFVRDRLTRRPTAENVRRALALLEMERNALRLFTSCAWFFDDVAGLEPRQVLSYAARALELARPHASKAPGAPEWASLRAGFLERLAVAEGNDPEIPSAAALFQRDHGARMRTVEATRRR